MRKGQQYNYFFNFFFYKGIQEKCNPLIYVLADDSNKITHLIRFIIVTQNASLFLNTLK